eukprot:gene5710-23467_t
MADFGTSTSTIFTAREITTLGIQTCEDGATYGSRSDGGGGSGDGVGIDAGYESIVYVATTGQADGVYAEVADAENAENAARQTLFSVVSKPSVYGADNNSNNHYDMAPPRRRTPSAQNASAAAAAVAAPTSAEYAEVASAVGTKVKPGAVQRTPNPIYVPAEEASGTATAASSPGYATASEMYAIGDGAAGGGSGGMHATGHGVGTAKERAPTTCLSPPRLKASRQRQPQHHRPPQQPQQQEQHVHGGGRERKMSVYAGFGDGATSIADGNVAESSPSAGSNLNRGRGSIYSGFTNIVNEEEC